MRPTVGRIVHYRPAGVDACLAALVTAVDDTGRANLAVFDQVGEVFSRLEIEEGPIDGGHEWHWPERAEA